MTPLRTYYRGHSLVAMRDEVAGQNRYYHFDHQGTTQALIDQTGAVTDRFACDAWGVQVKRTGTSINRQWYVGNLGYARQVDQALDYVRARFLSPRTAAWLSAEERLSVPPPEPYPYVRNQPALQVDPTGHQKADPCNDYIQKKLDADPNGLCQAAARLLVAKVCGAYTGKAPFCNCWAKFTISNLRIVVELRLRGDVAAAYPPSPCTVTRPKISCTCGGSLLKESKKCPPNQTCEIFSHVEGRPYKIEIDRKLNPPEGGTYGDVLYISAHGNAIYDIVWRRCQPKPKRQACAADPFAVASAPWEPEETHEDAS